MKSTLKNFLAINFGFVLLLSLNAQSATRVKFLPGNFNLIVNITETDIYGNPDTDSVDLYQIMNVEEQDSMLGKGKSIVSKQKDFNLVCSREKKSCHIILKKSDRTIISSTQKFASFKVTGDEAQMLTQKFKLNERQEVVFTATDKHFRVFGSSDTFLFETTGE